MPAPEPLPCPPPAKPAACEFAEPPPKLAHDIELYVRDGAIERMDDGGALLLDNYISTRKMLLDFKRKYGNAP